MHLGVLEEHLLVSEERWGHCVVGVLQVTLLLVGRKKGPTEETRGIFVGGFVVLLEPRDESFEIGGVAMDVAELLLVCHVYF